VDIMFQLSQHLLQSLKSVCEQSVEVHGASFLPAFRKGLCIIPTWNSVTQQHNTKEALEKHPDLKPLVKHAFLRYVFKYYENDKQMRLNISLPSIQDFVHVFYSRLAQLPQVHSMQFFQLAYSEHRLMIQDLVRFTLADLLQLQMSLADLNATMLYNGNNSVLPASLVAPIAAPAATPPAPIYQAPAPPGVPSSSASISSSPASASVSYAIDPSSSPSSSSAPSSQEANDHRDQREHREHRDNREHRHREHRHREQEDSRERDSREPERDSRDRERDNRDTHRDRARDDRDRESRHNRDRDDLLNNSASSDSTNSLTAQAKPIVMKNPTG
jgi:hypothetical protein